MSSKLEEARKIANEVDSRMAALFIEHIDNGTKMIDELNLVCDRLKVAGTFASRAEI